jgi:hypothetical protein
MAASSAGTRFVDAMLGLTPLNERRSRYADKPALFLDGREIADLEAPCVIDLRITHAGWARVRASFGNDPAVRPDKSRRDWLEFVLESSDGVAG